MINKNTKNMNESMFSQIDLIRQDSKDVRDFVKKVFSDREFKSMSKDTDFIKYLKSIYEGTHLDEEHVKFSNRTQNGTITTGSVQTTNETINEVNNRLNKKVKSELDAYLKGTKINSPEHQHAIMMILKGALTDANFHSEAKQLPKFFPKAKQSKYVGTAMEGVIEDKGAAYSKAAKWDGHDIIDAFSFYTSMTIGGSFGKKLETLKESISESVNEGKYNYKADALTAYFKGKIDAKELDKIARDDFKSGIATKKELNSFLSNKFTQDVMSDTYGIPAGALVKRVRGLMKFAEGVNEDESVNEIAKFAGWVAIDHKGKRLEIKKSEAKDLYNAKLLAIKKLKVPKSKESMLVIKPGYNESVVSEEQDCWDTHKVGNPKTKISSKTGKRVNNCVPKSESVSEGKDDFMARHGKADINLKKGYKHHNEDELTKLYDKVGKLTKDKKIKKVDVVFEDKSEIKGLIKKVGNKETKFYDVLSAMEKKYGKQKYRIWLEKSLKAFGANPKHYDYRTNAGAEEKLYQLGK